MFWDKLKTGDKDTTWVYILDKNQKDALTAIWKSQSCPNSVFSKVQNSPVVVFKIIKVALIMVCVS